MATSPTDTSGDAGEITLFLCGDVMTGRGVDQILPNPSAPDLLEPCTRSALDYGGWRSGAPGPCLDA